MGQPTPARECFPPALRFEVDAAGELTDRPAEPIAADLRPEADGKDNARLKLIAGMQAEVFVQTHESTPFEYFMKPLTDQFARAFREH